MSPTRVGIIGGGTCGPVMAIFLKLKGYEPVIYERAAAVKDRGLAIGYAPFCIFYTHPPAHKC